MKKFHKLGLEERYGVLAPAIREYIGNGIAYGKNLLSGRYEVNGEAVGTSKVFSDVVERVRDRFNDKTITKSFLKSVFWAYNEPVEKHNERTFLKDGFKRDKDIIERFLGVFSRSLKDPEDIELVRPWLMHLDSSGSSSNKVLFGTLPRMLFLIGEKGTGKTQFFKDLLPKGLNRYCLAFDFQSSKKAEPLMSKNLVIYNDDISKLSKKKHRRLMKLIDLNTYHNPSFRYFRTALLGCSATGPSVLYGGDNNRRFLTVRVKKLYGQELKSYLDDLASIDRDMLLYEICQLKPGPALFVCRKEINHLFERQDKIEAGLKESIN